MKKTLKAIEAHPELSLDLIVTGMHLSEAHGLTIHEIQAMALPIRTTIPVCLNPATGETMAANIGVMTTEITRSLAADRPDILLLLGDRGEMLAGAVAGIHLGVPVAHVCGGERSGTVDEPVRHAISKLSHLHFTSTTDARDRLIRMGERPDHIWAVGAPGLDGLADEPAPTRVAAMSSYGLDSARPFALLVYHPVLQEADYAGEHARLIVETLLANGLQILALMPNADAGAEGVRCSLLQNKGRPDFVLKTHLPRADFIALMAVADIMAGNSSAGIVEAATFGTPVLNVGNRQAFRERNGNVLDADVTAEALDVGIKTLLSAGRLPRENLYAPGGGGTAADRISQLLATVSLDPDLLFKINSN